MSSRILLAQRGSKDDGGSAVQMVLLAYILTIKLVYSNYSRGCIM